MVRGHSEPYVPLHSSEGGGNAEVRLVAVLVQPEMARALVPDARDGQISRVLLEMIRANFLAGVPGGDRIVLAAIEGKATHLSRC